MVGEGKRPMDVQVNGWRDVGKGRRERRARVGERERERINDSPSVL